MREESENLKLKVIQLTERIQQQEKQNQKNLANQEARHN